MKLQYKKAAEFPSRMYERIPFECLSIEIQKELINNNAIQHDYVFYRHNKNIFLNIDNGDRLDITIKHNQ